MQFIVQAYDAATRTPVRAVLFLVGLTLACSLPGFFTLQPMDRDEARFAQATKQMVETGDFIDIRLQDEPRYKKPAGIHWMQAAAVFASGQGADAPIWAYRVPSLLGAVAIVLLTYWAGLGLFDARTSVLGAMLMAMILLLGVEARLAKTDAVLTATIIASMGVLARLDQWRGGGVPTRLPVIFWGAAALGIMVKGPIWLMVVGLAALARSLTRRSLDWLKPIRPVSGIAVLVAVVAPWLIAINIVSDGQFLRMALGQDLLGKVATGQESHGAPPGTYVAAFLVTSWPMAAPFLLALGWIWKNNATPPVTFLLCWIVPSWTVFELVATKLPHYVLPIYPAMALLAAAAIMSGGLLTGRWWTRLLAALGAAALIYGPAVAIGLYIFAEGTLPLLAIAASLVSLVIGVFAVRAAWGERIRDVVILTALAAPFFYVSIYEGALARMQMPKVSERIVEMASFAMPCEPIRLVATGYEEASLVFLAGTETRWASPDEAVRHIAAPGCHAAAIEGRYVPAFRTAAIAADVKVEELGVVDGFNIGNGRIVRIVLFRSVPQ
ncbi:ArnT family glycosyltransferase [Tepidamorphus sp. 3E244]|uniref:ArnT family glycosyltransferase n=1 Tax=Tepidamorphus sp. 3E244 TaxID=3385498 RepID=UPI0038FCB8E9